MKHSLAILLWLALSIRGESQPHHVSVTNIILDKGQVEIVMNTFWKDWETAYFHDRGVKIDLSDPENKRDPWIDRYLDECFYLSLKEGGNRFTLEIDSILVDNESMTLKFEAEVPGDPDYLFIYNNLLTHIFPEQKNLVILSTEYGQSGIEFDIDSTGHSVPVK